jgi:hypothetical protein
MDDLILPRVMNGFTSTKGSRPNQGAGLAFGHCALLLFIDKVCCVQEYTWQLDNMSQTEAKP